MNALFRSRSPGQSIPLIAIMLVVLFGLVGLSVDVGNTYAEQRNVVRATNAAALAGIDAVIRGSNDPTVAKIINESLMANGMRLQGASTSTGEDSNGVTGNRTVRAYYM
ncbi:MAG: Tad domain-containing protein, partial [Roseiflexaceae bacterium]|nr:Tad domain-containing protein [Roseiflexaceae bacterium]